MRKSSKFILAAGTLAALAVPSAAMADANPAAFGQQRSYYMSEAYKTGELSDTGAPGSSEGGHMIAGRASTTWNYADPTKNDNAELNALVREDLRAAYGK